MVNKNLVTLPNQHTTLLTQFTQNPYCYWVEQTDRFTIWAFLFLLYQTSFRILKSNIKCLGQILWMHPSEASFDWIFFFSWFTLKWKINFFQLGWGLKVSLLVWWRRYIYHQQVQFKTNQVCEYSYRTWTSFGLAYLGFLVSWIVGIRKSLQNRGKS